MRRRLAMWLIRRALTVDAHGVLIFMLTFRDDPKARAWADQFEVVWTGPKSEFES